MSATQEKTPEIEPLSSFANLYGRRQARQLEKFLQDLRQREGQNARGNRRLILSDLFVARLLAFHHPTVRSLRTLDALSGTPTAQRMLEVQRLPRSTVSDTNKLVDPTLLSAIATGRRTSNFALAALEFVAAGLTELEQMQPMPARFEREPARLRRAKRRAARPPAGKPPHARTNSPRSRAGPTRCGSHDELPPATENPPESRAPLS